MTKNALIILMGLTIATGSAHGDDKWDVKGLDASKLPAAAGKAEITYAKDIRPLFEASCFRCHGEERHKGDLRLDTLEAVLKGGEDGKMVIPGKGDQSLLLFAAAQVNDDIAMPPKRRPGGPGGPGGPGNRPPGGPGGPQANNGPGGPDRPRGPGGPGGFGPPPKPLTPEQISLVRAWIDQGAK